MCYHALRGQYMDHDVGMYVGTDAGDYMRLLTCAREPRHTFRSIGAKAHISCDTFDGHTNTHTYTDPINTKRT